MLPNRFAPYLGAVVALVHASSVTASTVPLGLSVETTAREWLVAGPPSAGDSDLDALASLFGPLIATNSTASFPGGSSASSTVSQADFGFVDTLIDSNGFYSAAAGQIINAQGTSSASFRDEGVVVSAPGLGPGDFGTIVARFELNHTVALDIEVLSDDGGRVDIGGGFDLDVTLGAASIPAYNGTWTKSTVSGESSPIVPTGTIEIPVDFEYGVPFTIGARLDISLFTSVSNGIDANVDALLNLGSAFFWKGIDPDSLPEGATVSSDLVDDWTVPYVEIPSPGSLVALATGLVATTRRRRR